MIKRVVITNYLGETMEYKIDGVEVDNPSGLIITSIDGLGPVKANINMTDLATTDGQLFNSARLNGRNIVIKADFTHASSIEEARLLSYKYFPIKKKLTFLIETDYRTAKTEGYVESNEPDIFSEVSSCQISVLCEEPYFDGGKVSWKFSDTIPLLKFAAGNESLDEPLIKVSENADPSEVNKLDYNGDADTGCELKFELGPTDDYTESFKVTKIDITKDGNKTMGLDMSKMANLVPNTAANELWCSLCTFVLNDYRYKFFTRNPKTTFQTSKMVVFNDEIHCFVNYNGTDYRYIEHYKLDLGSHEWVEMSRISNEFRKNILEYAIIVDDILYTSSDKSDRQIFRYDDTANKFVKITDWPDPIEWLNRYESAIIIAYHDTIHLFAEEYTTYALTDVPNIHHYVFDGDSWDEIEYIKTFNPSHDVFPDYYSISGNTRMLEYNGQIHILGGRYNGPRQSGSGLSVLSYQTCHFCWDGTNWLRLNDMECPSMMGDLGVFSISSVLVYQDKIHIFEDVKNGLEPDPGTMVHHYIWDYKNGDVWIEDYEIPAQVQTYSSRTIVPYHDYMFSFGYGTSSDWQDIYTEEANNIKLIENDQLIVNTAKGKKSVTLLRRTNKYNVLNVLEKNPTWFELRRGANYFAYSAEGGDEDKLTLTITTNQWYEGV